MLVGRWHDNCREAFAQLTLIGKKRRVRNSCCKCVVENFYLDMMRVSKFANLRDVHLLMLLWTKNSIAKVYLQKCCEMPGMCLIWDLLFACEYSWGNRRISTQRFAGFSFYELTILYKQAKAYYLCNLENVYYSWDFWQGLYLLSKIFLYSYWKRMRSIALLVEVRATRCDKLIRSLLLLH